MSLARIGAALVALGMFLQRDKGQGGATVPGLAESTPPAAPAWEPPAAAGPYLAAIHEAEHREGIPHNLLARVLYQESRFRPDIINCKTVSAAGAKGIAQIVPKWHPGVNPCDPWESIDYAASYLAQLRHQAGSWERALAAYNWGIGNLKRHGMAGAPAETRNYVASIKADGFTDEVMT